MDKVQQAYLDTLLIDKIKKHIRYFAIKTRKKEFKYKNIRPSKN